MVSGRDDEGDEMASGQAPRVAVFAPHPLLTVTIEPEGPERQSIHLHAGGQGVWVARMIAALGATPMFCAMLGGETGELLEGILARALPEARLHIVACAAASGCYVTDRRSGERKLVALSLSDPPSRHELDELFSLTCAQALACGRLVVTNPMPASALPLEIYGDLVADARANGCQTFVDLSSPRLDSALRGEPDVVKLNDWELAEFVRGPVAEPEQLLAAAESLRAAGAHVVIVTRGEQPAVVLDAHGPRLLTPPRFEHGHREGCGDAMMGALAGALACGESFDRALRLGAAAGAANFLRHGLGSATHEVVERLLENVTLKPWPQAGSSGNGPPLTIASGAHSLIQDTRSGEHTEPNR